MLGVALRMSCCPFPKIQWFILEILFSKIQSVSKVVTSTKSFWFWYIGFINNSLGVTWRLCPGNFKNYEIDCTISQKKKTIISSKNLREAMLLLYDYIKNNDSEDMKHSKMNYKSVSTSQEYFLMWLTYLI